MLIDYVKRTFVVCTFYHFVTVTYVVSSKLSIACNSKNWFSYWERTVNIIKRDIYKELQFALRVVKPFLSQDSLKIVYYSYFYSIMTYGLIFWGNSRYSNIVFRLQKRIIRIIVGIRGRDWCREHFKKLKILPLQSEYILSLLLFVVDNRMYYRVNLEIHNISARNILNRHLPISKLSLYQKGPYDSGIKIFNNLPSQIKDLSHIRNQF
jgi:hypothetical protein